MLLCCSRRPTRSKLPINSRNKQRTRRNRKLPIDAEWGLCPQTPGIYRIMFSKEYRKRRCPPVTPPISFETTPGARVASPHSPILQGVEKRVSISLYERNNGVGQKVNAAIRGGIGITALHVHGDALHIRFFRLPNTRKLGNDKRNGSSALWPGRDVNRTENRIKSRHDPHPLNSTRTQ